MLFAPKPIKLKDLSTAILRSPNKGDAEAILHFLRTVDWVKQLRSKMAPIQTNI